MANYLSDRTGASIDTVLDDADLGNIGKDIQADSSTVDFDAKIEAGFYFGTSALGIASTNYGVSVMSSAGTQGLQLVARDSIYSIRSDISDTFDEIYTTGNVGSVTIAGAIPDGSVNTLNLGRSGGSPTIDVAIGTTALDSAIRFLNPNGPVGGITTSGTATAYNTSSDPRLKDFAEAPTDSAINAEFNSLFSCFRTFNWKSDPQGDLVWGFDAHACIDAKTGMGSEGEGSRGLNLGDVYETIPAVTENRVVNDAEGNPTSEIETVVITAAIEKKVLPAGVDQSKAVPILLAKIEQLERRLSLLGG